MGLRNRLARARQELLRGLERLAPTCRFQVLVFNRQIEPLLANSQNRWLQADRETLRRIQEALLALPSSGGTQPGQAVKRALTGLRPQHIVLLTDSEDLDGKEITALTQGNGGQAKIHVVDLQWRPGPEGSSPLRRLAAWNQGTYRQAGW